jgi:putative FmdB family regulatory protein
MPIYEYRCSACGFQKDFLQRLNEAPHTKCPECGKRTFSKQVTAAGFHLKGTGWYATDFKNSGAKPKAKEKEKGKEGGAEGPAKEATAKESSTKESSTKESSTKESSKPDSKSSASASPASN